MTKAAFPALPSAPQGLFDVLKARRSADIAALSEKAFGGLLAAKAAKFVGEKEWHGAIGKLAPKAWRVKFGIDPTGAEVHLGHAVPIMILDLFVRRGAKVDFIIGDFTAQVGDPSGRDSARKVLTKENIQQNLKTYADQIKPLFDLENLAKEGKARLHHNGEWMDTNYPLSAMVGILQKISLSAFTQRDDIRKRLEDGKPVAMAEALYSVLMGLDSAELKTNVEVGGVDQELNFWMCRDVQRALGQEPEVAVCAPIIEGTSGDGRKMSKSFGNYIALSASADDAFGLTMSIPDKQVVPWLNSFADVMKEEDADLAKMVKKEPLETKKQLATWLAFLLHGEEKALAAREGFERKFAKKKLTADDFVSVAIGKKTAIVDALKAANPDWSKTHIKSLLAAGAVKDADVDAVLAEGDFAKPGMSVKAGKLNLFKFE